jgi:hypothetical protein
MELGLPALGDVPGPPNIPSRSSRSADGASIALYVLSVVGLLLFIVIMILYIINWVHISERNKPLEEQAKKRTPIQANSM